MKSLILSCLVAIPALAFCQFNSSIDISGGGFATYRTLYTENHDAKYVVQNRKSEMATLNWSTGIYYSQFLSERLYLKSGVRLSLMGYRSAKYTDFRWGNQVDSNFTYDPTIPTMEPNSISEIQFVHQSLYIGIPVALRRELNGHKLTPYIEGGITPSLLLAAKTKQITNLYKRTFKDTYPSRHNLSLSGYVSIGLNYALSSNFLLFAQPIFNYHITATADAPIKEHLYGIGMEVGVRKKVKQRRLTSAGE